MKPCTPCERARLERWAWCVVHNGTTYCWVWQSTLPPEAKAWCRERGIPLPKPSAAHGGDTVEWPAIQGAG